MNNFLRIMAMREPDALRTVFVSSGKEGGINTIYDPESNSECYQVFIHNDFPYQTESSWEFSSYQKARSFASDYFKTDWEVLNWDGILNRPCKNENCGEGRSGNCVECATGGGCKSCGATDDLVL